MMVYHSDGTACLDCTHILANGELPGEGLSERGEDIKTHSKRMVKWCSNLSPVISTGVDEFSWIQCSCCGSSAGGYRHEVIFLTPVSQKTF